MNFSSRFVQLTAKKLRFARNNLQSALCKTLSYTLPEDLIDLQSLQKMQIYFPGNSSSNAGNVNWQDMIWLPTATALLLYQVWYYKPWTEKGVKGLLAFLLQEFSQLEPQLCAAEAFPFLWCWLSSTAALEWQQGHIPWQKSLQTSFLTRWDLLVAVVSMMGCGFDNTVRS